MVHLHFSFEIYYSNKSSHFDIKHMEAVSVFADFSVSNCRCRNDHESIFDNIKGSNICGYTKLYNCILFNDFLAQADP